MLRRFDLAKRALGCLRRHQSTSTREAPLSESSSKLEYRAGDVIHGFKVDQVCRIDEMHLDAVSLTHSSTGARYLHLSRDDSNNVFSINFRTIPRDSTGLPHVLEHTVLCGSHRYPCRDPFFKMLRRSLATFMNAMTGPDYTLYPVSTQNPKDLRNLQSVYLDTVFRPSLRELDFRQEGWRLEHADVHDPSSPIIFKGVVFNEMKGVFNENQAIFGEKLLNTILPSHTYGFCSGGDPLVIPQMTHKALVNFHSKHYHPSNARFYSYGNVSLKQHLKFVEELYLRDAKKIDVSDTVVPPEKRWGSPKRDHVTCRPDHMAADPTRQHSIAIAQLCNDIKDVDTTFDLYVISQLLLKGPNALFYKNLIESNLATGFGNLTGFETQIRDTMFAVSLQGVKSEDFTKIEKIYENTLETIVEEGFTRDAVEAVLHGIELHVKHQAANFGLNLLFSLTALWNHDGDLIKSLRINEAMKRFVDALDKDPKYLNKIVKKYLLENKHKLTLTMSPDDNYEKLRCAAEEKLLKSKLDSLSKEELAKIFEDGKILLADQQKEEPEVLPTLKIGDLKADVERYETRDLTVSDVPVQISVQPTNGISYYRAILNTRELDDEMKKLLPIFNSVVAKMGTKKNDYRSFDRLCELKTGGLSFSSHVADKKDSTSHYEEGILLQSYCLDKNAKDMWNIWEELFNEVELQDPKRLENLVKEYAGDVINGIADSGHHYAMSSAKSLVAESARLRESLSGLEHVSRMKNIARLENFHEILDKIRNIRKHVFTKNHLRSSINLSPENHDDVLSGMNQFYGALEGKPTKSRLITAHELSSGHHEKAIHHVMPYTVNYSSKAILTVPYENPEYPVLRILAKLITNLYLFPELREKGGAYGAGASLSPEGIFTFYSYRDPNSTRTLDIFDRTCDFLKKSDFTEKDIDEAKLGVFQQIDAPIPPGNRGLRKFAFGLDDDDVQRQRLGLMKVTREQLLAVADKYLLPGKHGLKIGRALIGPANSELENRASQGWNVLEQDEKSRARAC
ncbi:presequence protease, mitochondrial [Venturia canescens]|uniref:presequence protease, mitochondrial n=1 Tax=Venturia canescens TaxID=32260 RepID=UPI001C9BD33B|nr:presequence protease, mitochondrial [Venturia canescens]